jgi:hypothetical protein
MKCKLGGDSPAQLVWYCAALALDNQCTSYRPDFCDTFKRRATYPVDSGRSMHSRLVTLAQLLPLQKRQQASGRRQDSHRLALTQSSAERI